VKLVAACGPTRPRPASVLAKDSGEWYGTAPKILCSLVPALVNRPTALAPAPAAEEPAEWHRTVAPVREVGEITTHGLALSRPRRGFEFLVGAATAHGDHGSLGNWSTLRSSSTWRSTTTWSSGTVRGRGCCSRPVGWC